MNTPTSKNSESFLVTLLNICSGTEIFLRLTKRKISVVLWHFFLMSFLASTAYVILRVPFLSKRSYEYCDILHLHFGGVKISDFGIVPIKNQAIERNVRVMNTRIDYIPSKDKDKKINEAIEVNGVVWFPDSIYFWMRTNSGYNYVPLSVFLGIGNRLDNNVNFAFTLNELVNVARNDSFDFSALPEHVRGQFDFSRIGFSVFLILVILHFFTMLIGILFTVPLYALLLLSVFTLFGTRLLEKIRTMNLFVVILYASFPAIIIGVIFSGLSLPILDFKTICFIVFSVYSFVVIGNLQKKLYPSKEDEEDYDEDFF